MKILSFFLFLLFTFSSLHADCAPSCCSEEENPCANVYQPVFMENIPVECDKSWTLDVRVAYYAPNSKAVKDIYSGSWLDYQVEASRRIFNYVDFFAGVSWAGKHHGHGHPFRYGFKDHTRMYVLPLSMGFKWIYPILPCTEIYLGAGVCYSFLEIRNKFSQGDSYCYDKYLSAPYKRCIHKTGWGGVFKVGFHYTMSTSTFFDVFADYYLQRFHLSRPKYSEKWNSISGHYVDCSGFKFGAGLGVYF